MSVNLFCFNNFLDTVATPLVFQHFIYVLVSESSINSSQSLKDLTPLYAQGRTAPALGVLPSLQASEAA